MENNLKSEIYPELKDIIQAIKRYNLLHPSGCFLFNFVGWKKNEKDICPDCGKPVEEYDTDKSTIGGHGELEILREMSCELRDLIEDSVDEDGLVGF